MKTPIYLLLVLFFAITSCKKEDVLPADTCKLSTIDRGNGNKHTYTYDATGKITTMSREFDGNGSGKISKYLYTFTYDAANNLVKSIITLDGKASSTETYNYSNGKISKANYQSAEGDKGLNNIKYDSKGNIIEFSFEAEDKSYFDIQYFEFDANNIMVKRGVKDGLSGAKYFEVITKPIGVVKSPEQYLTTKGLPFDLLTGFSWSTNLGDTGTTLEAFYGNEKGVLTSDGIDKISGTKKDTRGYLTEISFENANKTTSKSTFSLIDCTN